MVFRQWVLRSRRIGKDANKSTYVVLQDAGY
jgi:hypothetical protein